jgi:hypothetical protein
MSQLLEETRMSSISKIKKTLESLKSKEYGEQCLEKKSKKIHKKQLLGVGGFGNVYKICTDKTCSKKSSMFGLKLSKIKKQIFENGPNTIHSDWTEILIMKVYINQLIKDGKGFNLPYLIEFLTCENCKLLRRNKGDSARKYNKFTSPCSIMGVELAKQDLYSWFNRKIKFDFTLLASCLFQIMAGLYFLQSVFQITNNDLKSKNILVYEIPKGGCIHYKIGNKDFFIPNFGYRFVINDFGLATCFYPYTEFNGSISGSLPNSDKYIYLGKRYACVKGDKFTPISGLNNYNFVHIEEIPFFGNKIQTSIRLERTRPSNLTWFGKGNKELTSKGVKIFKETRENKILDPEFLIQSKISATDPRFYDGNSIPPFEFFDDTQNAIRIFNKGGQTRQKPNHTVPNQIFDLMNDHLTPFNLIDIRNSSSKIFSTDPATVVALNFILKFFGKGNIFTKKSKSSEYAKIVKTV